MERLTIKLDGRNAIRLGRAYGASIEAMPDFENMHLTGDVADRLAAYEDAEEQERLVILPCKLGDTVWVLHTGFNTNFLHVYQGRCIEISQSLFLGATVESYTIDVYEFTVVYYGHDIGSTLFFSRSEAEAALKKTEG